VRRRHLANGDKILRSNNIDFYFLKYVKSSIFQFSMPRSADFSTKAENGTSTQHDGSNGRRRRRKGWTTKVDKNLANFACQNVTFSQNLVFLFALTLFVLTMSVKLHSNQKLPRNA